MSTTLKLLAQIGQEKLDLETAERKAVAKARREGASWQQIADALGKTKQGVWEKYK